MKVKKNSQPIVYWQTCPHGTDKKWWTNVRYWTVRPYTLSYPHQNNNNNKKPKNKNNNKTTKARERKKPASAATWWEGKKMAPVPVSGKKKTKMFTQQLRQTRCEPGESLLWVPLSQEIKLMDFVSFLFLAWPFQVWGQDGGAPHHPTSPWLFQVLSIVLSDLSHQKHIISWSGVVNVTGINQGQ